MSTYAVAKTTKEKLIDAAGNLAAERGIDNVSTRAVAELSGENIGSIHYHFGGKEGLFVAVARAAVCWAGYKESQEAANALGEVPPPREELARVARQIISTEVRQLFCSDRPMWHAQVIYQLLQRDDELYDIFRREVLEPSMDALERFFRLARPGMGDEEVFQRVVIMKMPIFAHANYMKAFLKMLGTDAYSDAYLGSFEDLLARQTLLSLGLPEA